MDAKLNAIVTSVRGRKNTTIRFRYLTIYQFCIQIHSWQSSKDNFRSKEPNKQTSSYNCNAFESNLIFFHHCLSLLVLCLSFVLFNFCSTEVTVAEDSDDEFAYEEVRYSCMRYKLTL